MNVNYFRGFIIKINTFHATECDLNPVRNTIPAVSDFLLFGFRKSFEKV